jgi:hypothetical protein
VQIVPIEPKRPRYLDRHWPDVGVQAQVIQQRHQPAIELGHRHGPQLHRPLGAGDGGDVQPLLVEIEVDLEALAVRVLHQRRGEPAHGQVERDIPPVVDQRRVL